AHAPASAQQIADPHSRLERVLARCPHASFDPDDRSRRVGRRLTLQLVKQWINDMAAPGVRIENEDRVSRLKHDVFIDVVGPCTLEVCRDGYSPNVWNGFASNEHVV